MKTSLSLGITIFVIVLIFNGCAAKEASPPSPQPALPVTSPQSIPPAPVPASIPEIDAWSKVVEAAKKEGKVNAYSYTWVGDVGLAIAKAFKERYGISVDIVTGRGAEFTERIKAEKRVRQQVADITEGSSMLLNNMKLEGLLASVADELPSLREKGVWLVDPTAIDPREKRNLAWRVIAYTPYVNTKLVKTEERPSSWKDLLDPKWRGKMSMHEPNFSSMIQQSIVVLMKYKVWDEDYIRAVYKQVRLATGSPEEMAMLSRGEVPLAFLGSDSTSGSFALEGAPIQAIDMKEGVVVSTASVAAIAGGPNPNAARVFLDWIYSNEGVSVAGRAQGNKMARKDVPDFRPKGAQTEIAKPLVATIEDVDKATQLFREKWFDKVVGR